MRNARHRETGPDANGGAGPLGPPGSGPTVSNRQVVRSLRPPTAVDGGAEARADAVLRQLFPEARVPVDPIRPRSAPSRRSPAGPVGPAEALPGSVVRSVAEPWRDAVRGVHVHPGADGPAARLGASGLAAPGRVFLPRSVLGSADSTDRHIVAHEVAHAVEGTPGLHAYARDLPNRNGDDDHYSRYFVGEITRGVADSLFVGLAPSTGSEFATWSPDASTFIERAAAWVARPGPDLGHLSTVLPHEEVVGAVRAGRVHNDVVLQHAGSGETMVVRENAGPLIWYPQVASRLAEVVSRHLRRSLIAVMPRYLAAADRAQQQLWEMEGSCDPTIPALPDAGSIVARSPVETVVIELLTAEHQLDVDFVAYRQSPEDAGPDPNRLRPVSVEFLTGEGLWYWVRVTEPPDPTPAEVAVELFGSSEYAETLTPAGSLFGLSNASALLPHHRVALLVRAIDPDRADPVLYPRAPELAGSTAQPGNLDPAAEILASGLAQEAMLGQAPEVLASRRAGDVLQDLHVSLVLLRSVGEGLAEFGPVDLSPATTELERRIEQLGAGDPETVSAWSTQAAGQRQLLAELRDGVSSLQGQLRASLSVGADPRGTELPAAYRMAFFNTAQAYGSAARVSALVGTARTRLDEANRQCRTLLLTALEGLMEEMQHSIHAMAGKEGAVGYQVRADLLQARFSALRPAAGDDPGTFALAVQALAQEFSDLQMEVSLAGQAAQLGQAWEALEEMQGFWSVVTGQYDDLIRMQQPVSYYKGRWRAILRTFNEGDHERAKADALALAQDPEQSALLAEVVDVIDDAQTAMLIGQIVFMIAAVVATAGAAAIAEGIAAGFGVAAMSSTMTAITLTTEVVAFTTISNIPAFVDDELTAGGFATDLALNAVTFGVMRRLSSLAQLGKGQWPVRAFALEHGGNIGVLTIATVAHGRIDELLHGDDREGGEDPDLGRVVAETTLFYAGVSILMRSRFMRQRYLEPLRDGSAALAQRARANIQLRLQVEAAADGVRTGGSRQAVEELLRLESEATRADEQLYREVERLAVDDPAAVERLGIDVAGVQARLGEAGSFRQSELMGRMRAEGGDVFSATTQQLPHVLRGLSEAGATIEPGPVELSTGLRSYRIETAGGERFSIAERVEARPGGIDQPAPTEAQARQARSEVVEARGIMAEMQAARQAAVDAAPTHSEIDHVTAGMGLAGTQASAALTAPRGGSAVPGVTSRAMPRNLIVERGAVEMWRGLADAYAEAGLSGQAGQPHTELQSPGLSRQPGEFNAERGGRTLARDVADAITLTQFEAGLVPFHGEVVAVERRAAQPDWQYPGRDLRVQVRSGTTGEVKYFYPRDGVTLAGGPGSYRGFAVGDPAAGAQMTATTEAGLRSSGRLTYGLQSLLGVSLRGKTVLISGGGASGAWAARAAVDLGAQVIWVGRRGQIDRVLRPDLGRRVDELQARLDRGEITAERFRELQAEIEAFGDAMLPVNESVFTDPKIQRRVGDIATVEQSATGTGVEVQLSGGGRPVTADHVHVEHGQVSSLPALAEGAAAPFEMVVRGGRVVGLRAEVGGVEVAIPAGSMNRGLGELLPAHQRGLYDYFFRAQAADRFIPEHSRGVPGGAHRIGQTVPELRAPYGDQSPAVRGFPLEREGDLELARLRREAGL